MFQDLAPPFRKPTTEEFLRSATRCWPIPLHRRRGSGRPATPWEFQPPWPPYTEQPVFQPSERSRAMYLVAMAVGVMFLTRQCASVGVSLNRRWKSATRNCVGLIATRLSLAGTARDSTTG